VPKPLSLASVIEANRIASEVPFLCLIDVEVVNPTTGVVVTTLHIARNSEEVVFDGNTYEPGVFDIQLTAEAGQAAEVTLSVNDYTQAIQGMLEAYGGGVGSNVTFYLVNADNLDQGPEVVEYFQITATQSGDYIHQFTLGAENTLMQTFPRRRQTKDFCQWRYKSTECGYTGGLASCDLTLQGPNGCRVHSNSNNFGAFPGLNGNGYRYA
jgi:phage-related protein